MKTIKLIKVVTILVAMVALVSCVNDDDFAVPDFTVEEPQLDGAVISIAALESNYEQELIAAVGDLGLEPGDFGYEEALENLRESFTLDLSDSTQFVEGYVISSDESGNWFEEIIMQDAAANPTAGIRTLIDNSPLYTSYEIGRKIYVKLGGLSVGDSNGVLTLGLTANLEKIPSPLQNEFVFRSTEVATITPTDVAISDFNEVIENTFIQLSDVQFIKEEVINQSLTFAAEPLDEFDGERTIIACGNNQTVILSTSTFADFKTIALPAGRGTIAGVLTRNFFGDTFNFVINDVNDIAFEDIARCDPAEIDCGVAASAGADVLFEDFFETQSTNQAISGNGWTNFQQEGTQAWEAYTSGGTNASLGVSARVGSFMSGDAATISWLVTPQFDFDAQDGETLQFQTSNSFSDGSTLDLLFSSDWDGTDANIPAATWDVLPAATIVTDDDFFGDWIPSGIVDLSCIEGSGYIAFRYIGSGDEDFDGTFELDEIEVNAQQ